MLRVLSCLVLAGSFAAQPHLILPVRLQSGLASSGGFGLPWPRHAKKSAAGINQLWDMYLHVEVLCKRMQKETTHQPSKSLFFLLFANFWDEMHLACELPQLPQKASDFAMAEGLSHVQWQSIFRILDFFVSPSFQKQFNHLLVALATCQVQSCCAIF